MVELRKRPPPKEPPMPAPAAKKGRAAASTSSSRAKQAPKREAGVTAKAKAAATKIKQAVAGPVETKTTDNQPTVENEAVIEEGESGMIPETAGTAPSTTTIPAESAEPNIPTTDTALAGRSKGPLTETPAQATVVNDKAGAMGIASTTTTPATPVTSKTGEASTIPSTEAEVPATEDLEHPPEKGKVEPANESLATTAASGSEVAATGATATLPLSTDSVGKQIPSLGTFGGQLETHAGQKVSVAELLSQGNNGGIIIFTYPKASTPGCTQQACSFRDNYDAFTATSGYKIFGLSADSTKANTTFATKQNLQYPLLCDPAAALTGALGMKKAGNAKGTLRGVVVIDSKGVVKVWFQGGPAKTVDMVKEYLGTLNSV